MEVKNNLTAPLQNDRKSDLARMNPGASEKNHRQENRSRDYQVSVSPQAREREAIYQKALQAARDAPEVREDRIAELKAQIQQGQYKIDSGKIADGMLREAVKHKLSYDG